MVLVVRGSASVFRQSWFEPSDRWHNEQLNSQFEAVLALRSAFYTTISSDKPGDYDLTIACSHPLFELLQVTVQFFFFVYFP